MLEYPSDLVRNLFPRPEGGEKNGDRGAFLVAEAGAVPARSASNYLLVY